MIKLVPLVFTVQRKSEADVLISGQFHRKFLSGMSLQNSVLMRAINK